MNHKSEVKLYENMKERVKNLDCYCTSLIQCDIISYKH